MKRRITALFAAISLLVASCDRQGDGSILEKVDSIKTELDEIKTQLSQANDNIGSLQTIVGSLQSSLGVSAVEELSDADGQIVGHKIVFSDGTEVKVYEAAAGYVPSVSIKKDSDGRYYWTLDGDFIIVDGQKMPAEGAKGDDGVTGITPKLRINDGKWEISYDDGGSWETLGESGGAVSSTIKVEYDDESVTFILDDGEIVLPRVPAFALKVVSDEIVISPGAVVEIAYSVIGANEDDKVVVYVHHQTAGFSAEVVDGKIRVTAPEHLSEGIVVVEAVNNTTGAVSAQALIFEGEVIEVASDSYTVPAEGGQVELSITTNTEYCINIPAEVYFWLRLAETKALRNCRETLIVDKNQGYSRTAIVSIVGQDGYVAKVVIYQEHSTDTPETLDYGVGQISCLFGWQATTDDPHGMTCSDNRTIAVVGSQLILSNAYDYTQMPVYDRMTGEYLGNNIVNTTGIDSDDIIHAITQDDAGHMVAATYVCNYDDAYRTPSKSLQVRIYVWKDGIESAPVKIFDEDFLGPVFDRAPVGINLNANVTGQDCFHVIDVAGDMLSGDAVLTTSSRINSRPVFLFFKDGEFVGKDGNGKADITFHSVFGSGSNYSMWVSTKVVVMDPQAKEYFHQSGNTRHNICYSNEQIGMRFETPKAHWWAASGSTNPLRGMDVVDFNGARILAVQNALSIYDGGKVGQFPVEAERTDKNTYTHRLAVRTYVADVTMTPNANSLIDGFIFDTRQGRSAEGDIPGTGYCPSGMTSPYAFTSGEVVGSNWPEAGDVVLYRDPSGHSIQLYSLTPGQGLLAYNLTDIVPE